MGDLGLCDSQTRTLSTLLLHALSQESPLTSSSLNLTGFWVFAKATRYASGALSLEAPEPVSSALQGSACRASQASGRAEFTAMSMHECVADCPFWGGTGLWGCEQHQ